MDIKSLSYTEKIELVAIGKLSQLDFVLCIQDLDQNKKDLLIDEVEKLISALRSSKQHRFYIEYTEYNHKRNIPLIIDLHLKHNKRLPVETYEKFPEINDFDEKGSLPETYNPKFVDVFDDEELFIQPIHNLERLKEAIEKKPEQTKGKPDQNENKVEVTGGTNKDKYKDIDPFPFKNIVLKTKVEKFFQNVSIGNYYKMASCFWRLLDLNNEIDKQAKPDDFYCFLDGIKTFNDERYDKYGFDTLNRSKGVGRQKAFKDLYRSYSLQVQKAIDNMKNDFMKDS